MCSSCNSCARHPSWHPASTPRNVYPRHCVPEIAQFVVDVFQLTALAQLDARMPAERFAKVLAGICWNGAAQRHHLQGDVKFVGLLHGAIWQLNISDCLRMLRYCCGTCFAGQALAMEGHDVQ